LINGGGQERGMRSGTLSPAVNFFLLLNSHSQFSYVLDLEKHVLLLKEKWKRIQDISRNFMTNY